MSCAVRARVHTCDHALTNEPTITNTAPGAPPPPPPPGGLGAKAQVQVKKYNPKTQMKRVNWQKLPPNKVRGKILVMRRESCFLSVECSPFLPGVPCLHLGPLFCCALPCALPHCIPRHLRFSQIQNTFWAKVDETKWERLLDFEDVEMQFSVKKRAEGMCPADVVVGRALVICGSSPALACNIRLLAYVRTPTYAHTITHCVCSPSTRLLAYVRMHTHTRTYGRAHTCLLYTSPSPRD